MPDSLWEPADEQDAADLHARIGGDGHWTFTTYKGTDGRLHARCECGWDSATWADSA